MPIKPENKALYPDDWDEISARIRYERADNKCEQCNAPNLTVIYRGLYAYKGSYMLDDGRCYDDTTGAYLGLKRGSLYDGRPVRVVLTVAHLNHDPRDNADDNLKALCQMCHNRLDISHRVQTRALTAAKKKVKGQSPLFDLETRE